MFKRYAPLLLLLVSQSLLAQGPTQLAGVWRLVSFVNEFQATGERREFYGKNPSGYLILGVDGRMMAIVAGEGRKFGVTDAERAALHRSLIAYTGKYRIEGEKFVTTVDVSWNETWTGTEQIRFFKVDGNRLDIVSAWAPMANLPNQPISRGILTWERAN